MMTLSKLWRTGERETQATTLQGWQLPQVLSQHRLLPKSVGMQTNAAKVYHSQTKYCGPQFAVAL